jgi:hypothetical protein
MLYEPYLHNLTVEREYALPLSEFSAAMQALASVLRFRALSYFGGGYGKS